MEHATRAPSDQQREGSACHRPAAPREAATLVDNRPAAVAQRELAFAVSDSPRVIAQQTSLRVAVSPRVIAQGSQLEGMFGNALQRRSHPAHVSFNRPGIDAPAAVQRKIDYGDAHDLNSPSYKWEEEFKRVMNVPLSKLPAYNAFWNREGMHIHLDATRTDRAYFDKVATLFSDKENAQLDVPALNKLAPDVVISETKKHEAALGNDQVLGFTDQQQTIEEQQISGDKLEKLVVVVQEARQRIAAILEQLVPLMKGIEALETGKLRQDLARLLNASDEQVGKCLPNLHRVMERMHERLQERVIEVSTMDRRTTKNEPTTLGKSGPGPKLADKWMLDEKKPDLAGWSSWLHGNERFGGSLQVRVDSADIVGQYRHKQLVHTFVHELSHAAASTRDFAYLHEKDYEKVTFLERVANADTVAQIVMELTQGPELKQPDIGGESTEVKLGRGELIARIVELARTIQDKGVLQVAVHKLLTQNDAKWDQLEEDPALEDIGHLQLAML